MELQEWIDGVFEETDQAINKYYSDYPIYFELDDILYVQTLKKYNQYRRFIYNGNS